MTVGPPSRYSESMVTGRGGSVRPEMYWLMMLLISSCFVVAWDKHERGELYEVSV